MGRQIGRLLMATLALGLASCGSQAEQSPEREGPQITQARLIERGDAICKRDRERVSRRLTDLPKAPRSARVGEIIAPILEANEESIRGGVRRIEALGRPTSGAAALDDFLDERISAANALRAGLRAARKEDLPALDAALRIYNRSEAAAAATRFGFKVCGLGFGQIIR